MGSFDTLEGLTKGMSPIHGYALTLFEAFIGNLDEFILMNSAASLPCAQLVRHML